MCLKIKNRWWFKYFPLKAKIAKSDISVAKFYIENDKTKLTSPFQGTINPYGELQEVEFTYTKTICDNIGVEGGYHSFETLHDASWDAIEYAGNLCVQLVVVLCIIPKGALYYKGTYNKKMSYVSNKLKIVKPIIRNGVVIKNLENV